MDIAIGTTAVVGFINKESILNIARGAFRANYPNTLEEYEGISMPLSGEIKKSVILIF